MTNNKIEIYPNPTTTELTITSTNKLTKVAISNLLGQTVYTHEYNTEQVQVSVADLPKGIYFVKVNGTEVRKFVKF
ncbi:MAG: T9SS type A sorting domain-containing protein [Chitinophagales bacterium]